MASRFDYALPAFEGCCKNNVGVASYYTQNCSVSGNDTDFTDTHASAGSSYH
jgi:hypothetical protein